MRNRHFKIGKKVRVKGIVDPGPKVQDSDLNGRVGTLAKAFPHIPFGDVGIYLQPVKNQAKQRIETAERANLKWGEWEDA